MVRTLSVANYADSVRGCSIARQLLEASSATINDVNSSGSGISDLLCAAEERIFSISERNSGSEVWTMETLGRYRGQGPI